jgi:hypothetical protein
MARFGGNGLEVGEKNVEPAFGLLKHTRKGRREGGTGEGSLASRRGRCACIYAVRKDKYANAKQGKSKDETGYDRGERSEGNAGDMPRGGSYERRARIEGEG